MSDTIWIALVIGVALMFLLKRSGQVGLEEAKAQLAQGAKIIDVRSQQEYLGGSVRGSVNIPLDGVVAGVEKRFPDKGTVLLCHCASGMRSGNAVRLLRAAGYAKASNLGSYGRAAKLVG